MKYSQTFGLESKKDLSIRFESFFYMNIIPNNIRTTVVDLQLLEDADKGLPTYTYISL